MVAAKQRGFASEQLLVGAADLCVLRGQPDAALGLLESAETSAGLLLSADIRADRGEVARALALAERVLARDFDAPGARERRERWAKIVGFGVPAASTRDEATIIRHEPENTGLKIVGEAGRGGSGTVYEAIDEQLGRRVAFKVYHRPDEERDQLEREARVAVSLSGRGIVRILDADPERGFIVMEWVWAGALKRAVQRGDAASLWPIDAWFVPLVQAVARVHARGLVHADLKPANVLLRGPGEPVVSDFSSARAAGEPGAAGTIGYLSPERLAGERLKPADDVYALGRILEDALLALGPDVNRTAPHWQRIVRETTELGRPETAAGLVELIARTSPPA